MFPNKTLHSLSKTILVDSGRSLLLDLGDLWTSTLPLGSPRVLLCSLSRMKKLLLGKEINKCFGKLFLHTTNVVVSCAVVWRLLGSAYVLSVVLNRYRPRLSSYHITGPGSTHETTFELDANPACVIKLLSRAYA